VYELRRQQDAADGKIVGRALGLGAKIGICGNTHRSHGIYFFSKFHGCYLDDFYAPADPLDALRVGWGLSELVHNKFDNFRRQATAKK
jgi:hypothetical protein